MMRRITITGVALVALFASSAMAASGAQAASAPHWSGKGLKEAVVCKLWFLLSYGWPTETECLNGGIPTLGLNLYLRLRSLHGKSTTSLKFSDSIQSVECGKMSYSGGIFNFGESESMVGLNVEELTFSECKVWKGAFESELKECHVASVGEASGVIKFSADTELVYLNEEGTSIGDLYTSGSGEKKLVELDFTGTGCTTSGEVEISGNALSEVSPKNEEVTLETGTFPTTAIKKCWQWSLPSTLKECGSVGLKAFGLVTVTLSGKASAELESKETFDVHN
jgi:hypothetical protein